VLARGDEVIEQSGDFRLWHKADVLKAGRDVRFRGVMRTSPGTSPFLDL
jgi:hypothetical protein